MPHEQPDPQDQPTATGADRRVWARAESSRPIPRRLYLVDDFQPLDGWVTDLSQGGLALLTSAPLPVGATLFLELESAPEVDPIKVWATVRRNFDEGDDSWRVGCEFVNYLSDAELQALLR